MEHHRITQGDFPALARFADGSEPFITDKFAARIRGRALPACAVGDAFGVFVHFFAADDGLPDESPWVLPLGNSAPGVISSILAGLPSPLTEDNLRAIGFLTKAEIEEARSAAPTHQDEPMHAVTARTWLDPRARALAEAGRLAEATEAEIAAIRQRSDELAARAEALQAELAYLRSRVAAAGGPVGPATSAVGVLGTVVKHLLLVSAGMAAGFAAQGAFKRKEPWGTQKGAGDYWADQIRR